MKELKRIKLFEEIYESIFTTSNNQLSSLDGAPKKISNYSRFSNCDIDEIIEEFSDDLYASDNPEKLIAHEREWGVYLYNEFIKSEIGIRTCIDLNITSVTDGYSDDVKNIAGAALKGNHKLR